MARQKGMLNLSGNLEPLAGAPLDSRDITPTVADLYIASNWPYKYIGMKTTVTATGDTYRLVNLDVTQESSWVKEGSESGQTIQYDELPAASSSLAGKIYQYTGVTNVQYTNGYFYECVNDGGTYKWVQTNTQPGSGGGHTIQEDGIDMTSRAALNFVGMDLSDNSEDDSTDVEEHRLTSAEISEIMGGIPNPQPRYPVIFDERGTEYKVGWYILANGTKKPVYEKTKLYTNVESSHTTVEVDTIDSSFYVIGLKAYAKYSNGGLMIIPYNQTSDYNMWADIDQYKIRFHNDWSPAQYPVANLPELYVTIRYTKTTDTPV